MRLPLPASRTSLQCMSSAPRPGDRPQADTMVRGIPMWNVVVWDDPVNLMSYVVWVFRTLLGRSREEATRLMLEVHHRGRAVVASAPREHAELNVYHLHHHGLWATLEER